MSDDRFVSKVGISAVHEPSPPLHKYTFWASKCIYGTVEDIV